MQQVSTRSTAVALAFFALIGVSTGALAQSDAGSKSVADDLVTIQERIEATSAEIERLKKLIEGAEGGFRAILERRLESRQVQIVDDVNKLGSMILANKESGEDVSQMQRIQTGYLQRLLPGLRKQIDRLNGDLIALQSAAPAENMRDAMSKVLETNTATSTLVDWYAAYQRSTQSLNSFGIDAAS